MTTCENCGAILDGTGYAVSEIDPRAFCLDCMILTREEESRSIADRMDDDS